MAIGRVEHYIDTDGRHLSRIQDIDTGAIEFVGKTMVVQRVARPDGRMKEEVIPAEFEIDAKSIKEAFKTFEKYEKKFAKDLLERMKEKKRQASSAITEPSIGDVSRFGKKRLGGNGGGNGFSVVKGR